MVFPAFSMELPPGNRRHHLDQPAALARSRLTLFPPLKPRRNWMPHCSVRHPRRQRRRRLVCDLLKARAPDLSISCDQPSAAMPMFAVPFERISEWNEFRLRHRADERLSVVEPSSEGSCAHPLQRLFRPAPYGLIPIFFHNGHQTRFGFDGPKPAEGERRAGTDIGMIVLEGLDEQRNDAQIL